MENYFLQGIKKIGLWAVVVIMILVAVGVRSLRPKDNGDTLNVFGHIYCSGETVAGETTEETWMIRLEQDKTVLMRGDEGIWENLGTVSRVIARNDAMEIWKTGDEKCRILVLRDGVQLELSDRRFRLIRVDTLNVGVNTEEESQFLAPQWYQDGEEVKTEQLRQCSVSGPVTLVLNLEEYEDTLTVIRDGEELVLNRDRSRAFLLDIQGEPGEIQVYEVPFEKGAYRFALVFA